MARFGSAIGTVLAHEGVLANHPNDPGGITKYGISLRWLKSQGDIGDKDLDGDVDADDIRALTRADAEELYLHRFWVPNGYQKFLSQRVATKVFDMAVNMGPKQAHKLLQRALNKAGESLAVDGVLGPLTMAAANRQDGEILLDRLRTEQEDFYLRLVDHRPSMAVFLKGWLRRARA